MSVARITTVKKSRKEWKCGKCGDEIKKGEPVLHFAVGFRGLEQHRCAMPGCFPKPSERESSAVASVLAAQEEFDVSNASSLEELEEAVSAVSEAATEVAEEYENNEMFEINQDLQERAETLNSAAEALEGWQDDLDDIPVEEEEDSWLDHDSFEEAFDDWIEEARRVAEEAVNEMELP